MQVRITARHGQLSDATREKISAKFAKLARLDRLTSIEITVDLEHKENPSVDVQVSTDRKHDFVATERSGDLMASIDGVLHKLERQLKKHKEKVQDHHRTPGHRGQEVPVEPESQSD